MSYSSTSAKNNLAAHDLLHVISQAPRPALRVDNPFLALAIDDGIKPGEPFSMIVPESWQRLPDLAPWLTPEALKQTPWLTVSRFVVQAMLVRGHLAAFTVPETFHEVPHGTSA